MSGVVYLVFLLSRPTKFFAGAHDYIIRQNNLLEQFGIVLYLDFPELRLSTMSVLEELVFCEDR
jgi:hypothetical protein